MKLEVINPETLTYKDIVSGLDELYVIYPEDPTILGLDRSKPIADIKPFRIYGDDRDITNTSGLIVRISFDDALGSEEEEIAPPPEPKRDKPVKTWQRQAYKIDASNKDQNIFVEGRPNGDIRVSFKNKDTAIEYLNTFRDLFYHQTTGADAITVASLYSELHLDIDYSGDTWKQSKKFGWLTIDHGPCKYISDQVSLTKDTKMHGFTIKRPVKLYFKEEVLAS